MMKIIKTEKEKRNLIIKWSIISGLISFAIQAFLGTGLIYIMNFYSNFYINKRVFYWIAFFVSVIYGYLFSIDLKNEIRKWEREDEEEMLK